MASLVFLADYINHATMLQKQQQQQQQRQKINLSPITNLCSAAFKNMKLKKTEKNNKDQSIIKSTSCSNNNKIIIENAQKKPLMNKQSLVRDNNVAALKHLFKILDADQDGKISAAELRTGIQAYFDIEDPISDDDIRAATDNDDGMLSYEDFAKLIEGDEEENEEERVKNLKEAFRVYEMEGEGCITPTSLSRALRRVCGTSNRQWTPDECALMIRPFDVNGDGVLSFDEFQMMVVQVQ